MRGVVVAVAACVLATEAGAATWHCHFRPSPECVGVDSQACFHQTFRLVDGRVWVEPGRGADPDWRTPLRRIGRNHWSLTINGDKSDMRLRRLSNRRALLTSNEDTADCIWLRRETEDWSPYFNRDTGKWDY
jgi:hypothetical protein